MDALAAHNLYIPAELPDHISTFIRRNIDTIHKHKILMTLVKLKLHLFFENVRKKHTDQKEVFVFAYGFQLSSS